MGSTKIRLTETENRVVVAGGRGGDREMGAAGVKSPLHKVRSRGAVNGTSVVNSTELCTREFGETVDLVRLYTIKNGNFSHGILFRKFH